MASDTSSNDHLPAHPQALRVRRVRLTVVKGPNKGSSHVSAESRIRVGKSDGNDLVVPDDTVSRHHFEIVHDSWGYLLRDLDSTNGTYLDGAKIREAYIRPGSVVTAGQAKIKFRPQEDFLEIAAWSEDRLGQLVGRSRAMRLVFGAVEAAARLDVPVLFYGEKGTGRRTLARILHGESDRHRESFTEADCAVSSLKEIEKTLFGARGSKGSLFDKRPAGSLLLSEPWELPLEIQSRLVKAMEPKTDRPVAGSTAREKIRLLSVSRRDLSTEVDRGKMDGRLAAHLATIQIQVPPLRQRPEDVDALVDRFVGSRNGGKNAAGRLPSLLKSILRRHTWPGNVPELEGYVNLLMDVAETHPEGSFLALMDGGLGEDKTFRGNKRQWIDDFERLYLSRLIEKCQENVSQAARLAGMDRKYLNNLLKRHGLKE